MTVRWYGRELNDAVRAAAMRAVVRGTESLRTEAINLILNTPKSGGIRRRRGVIHQASAPGEPPASDTGRLVNSITTSFDFAQIAGLVNFGTSYAAALEFGTEKMEPRPYARPAVANRQAEIQADLTSEINAVVRA